MFFDIIDSDGNGLLSKEEVLEISKMCLTRFSKPDVEDFIDEMAEHFTQYIFNAMDMDMDDEIPMVMIKERIFKEGADSLDKRTKTLLCLFCNADNIIFANVIKNDKLLGISTFM